MKKTSLYAIILLIALAVTVASIALSAGEQFSPEREGVEKSISWSMVNLRDQPSLNSTVISELHCYETVTLTGYSYHYTGGNGRDTESWQKVVTEDGKEGWIVSTSIQWI